MRILTLILFGTFGAAAIADQHVNTYTRKDGTVVHSYERTDRNNTTSDNYTTRGNTNPYTGQKGYKPDTKPSNDYENTNE